MRVDLDPVGHRYADGPLLFHDLTASLVPGHVYALTGPNGAGKSTLLGNIAVWPAPAEGQVTRQGIDSMRWIFQNPHGVAQRTAIDHVSLPLLAKGLPRCEAEEQARTLMDRFNLARVADRRFAELSGGEAQRLPDAGEHVGEEGAHGPLAGAAAHLLVVEEAVELSEALRALRAQEPLQGGVGAAQIVNAGGLEEFALRPDMKYSPRRPTRWAFSVMQSTRSVARMSPASTPSSSASRAVREGPPPRA